MFNNTDLMLAAASGDIEKAKSLIASGVDVDARNDNGETALIIASNNKHTEIMYLLVDNGADMQAKDNNGKKPSPLIDREKIRRLKLLIKNPLYMERALNALYHDLSDDF